MKPTALNIRPGDVLLCRGTSWFAKLIRFHQRLHMREPRFPETGAPDPRTLSHAGIFAVLDSTPWVIEAMEGKGVRAVPLGPYLDLCEREGSVCYLYRLTDDHIDGAKAARFACAQVGKEYVRPGQFAVSFSRFFRLAYRWLFPTADTNVNHDRFFCSELVVTSLQDGGLPRSIPAQAISPGRLAEFWSLEYAGVISRKGSINTE